MPAGLIVVFAVYGAALLVLTWRAWRRTRTLDDYLLGGRDLSAGTGALSAGASDMSGWLLLGLPGAVYVGGLSAGWIGVGLTAGALASWTFVAPRLRAQSEALGALTLPAYLDRRLGATHPGLRITVAVVVLVFFTVYVAAGLVGGARLFESVLGLSYLHAMGLGTVVIVVYTVAGGFLAVSWTDALQATLMLIALLLLPALALAAGATPRPEALAPFTQDMTALGFLSLVAWGLGYPGQPHILTRYMALRSADDVPRARTIGMSWMALSLIGALGVGLTGAALFADAPLADPETVLLQATRVLLNPWLAGIVLAAVLAAIMSTVDSQLLVASSALTEDLGDVLGLRTEQARVRATRVAVAVLAVVAVAIAWNPDSRVLALVSFAWAGLGGAVGPVVLLCLYWRGLRPVGAAAGMAAGAVVMIVWQGLSGGLFDLYEIVPGYVATTAVAVAVSRLVPAPEHDAAPEPADPA